MAGNRETRYFAATAFTFEDNKQLIGEQTALFDYRYLSQTSPEPSSAPPQERRGQRLYTARDHAERPGRAAVDRLFRRSAAPPLQTLSFEDLSQTARGRWRADRIVLRQRDGSQTILKVRKRVFTQAYMTETDGVRRTRLTLSLLLAVLSPSLARADEAHGELI